VFYVTDPFTTPQPPVPNPQDNTILLAIGDVSVTKDWVIVPHGRYPLRGTTWSVQDSSQVTEEIPTYAIVLAVVFGIFCLIGLLFLLIKEKRYSGFILVTVAGPGLYHSVQLPPGPENAAWAANQVNYARNLAAFAG
jgi:hypothetical protein